MAKMKTHGFSRSGSTSSSATKPMRILKFGGRANCDLEPALRYALGCGCALSRNAVRSSRSSAADITADPRVRQALAKLAGEAPSVTEEQIRITEIPAPSFRESLRGTHLAKLLSDAGLKVHTDQAGNVIGERAGSAKGEFVLITAHLDTVFPAGTDVHVRREGSKLRGPGISDNGTGLATLPAIARIMRDTKLETRSSILFAADVGEEGEGNLRGIRKLVENYRKQLRYVIALDGASIDYVTTAALASRRVEITVTGPGGHSWSDFGVPNPIDALARGIALFVKTPAPESPRTTFNIGSIEGGTSVNSIPAKAVIKVDLRSEAEPEILKLEAALRRSIQNGVDEEMQAARERGVAERYQFVDRYKGAGTKTGRRIGRQFSASRRSAGSRRLSGQSRAHRTIFDRRQYSALIGHSRDCGWGRRNFRRRTHAPGMVRSHRPRDWDAARFTYIAAGGRAESANRLIS